MAHMNSASCYVTAPIDTDMMQKDEASAHIALINAAAACRALAVERTGGEEGLALVSQHQVEQGGVQLLATTWSRQWADPEPEPEPASEAEAPAEPA
jgi:hypothetical protein